MTTQTEALKLALESMKRIDAWLIQRGYTGLMPQEKEVITSIEAALAQQEQEPVGYVQTVIEALYENGDPISVDAAELLQRISAQPEHEPVAWLQFRDNEPPVVAPRDLGTPVFLGIRGGLAHDAQSKEQL